MITIKVIVATVILLIVLSIIPRIIIYDSTALTSEEIKCTKQEASLLFDNPIEKIIIQKFAVEKIENGVSKVTAYTLGGLRYATAEITCNHMARVTWRRWFGK